MLTLLLQRYWTFTNQHSLNAYGDPKAYKLEPVHAVTPFARPDSPNGKRMGFVYNSLWVTPYDREERYPGMHLNINIMY